MNGRFWGGGDFLNLTNKYIVSNKVAADGSRKQPKGPKSCSAPLLLAVGVYQEMRVDHDVWPMHSVYALL